MSVAKVQCRWFKNYIFAKKCSLISNNCFYYSFTHYYCAIFHSLDAGFFNTIRLSNSLDPDQARHFVGPDLGPNCLQWLSADNKMSGWIWVQTVCKGDQQTTKVGKELNTNITFWLKPWHLATTFSIWLKCCVAMFRVPQPYLNLLVKLRIFQILWKKI